MDEEPLRRSKRIKFPSAKAQLLQRDSPDTDSEDAENLRKEEGYYKIPWTHLPELLPLTANKTTVLSKGRNGQPAEPPYRTTLDVRNFMSINYSSAKKG